MPDTWNRDQLLVTFNLYCKLPFSKTKANNPTVIETATLIGRSPSAVAMKLGNFGSFDPALKSKGIKGLTRAAKADKDIWEEFNHNWQKLSLESEIAAARLIGRKEESDLILGKLSKAGDSTEAVTERVIKGPSEKVREVKVRLHQRFFRGTILGSYGNSCCVCANPIPELLTAGHIIPWSAREDLRTNPRNGLCLCSLHHEAFDCGLWSIDARYKIVLSSDLEAYLPNQTLHTNFVQYAHAPIRMPDKFWPEQDFLAHHRNNCFRQLSRSRTS